MDVDFGLAEHWLRQKDLHLVDTVAQVDDKF